MQNSISQRPGFSVLQSEERFQIGNSLDCTADADVAVLPHVYRPCRGTWAEFAGDVKMYFDKSWAEFTSRVEGMRENLRRR